MLVDKTSNRIQIKAKQNRATIMQIDIETNLVVQLVHAIDKILLLDNIQKRPHAADGKGFVLRLPGFV